VRINNKNPDFKAILLVFLLTLIVLPKVVFAIEPKEIAKKVFPSVVLLTMNDKNGNPMSLGSGFVVQKDVIATNMHVIRGAVSGTAKLVGQNGEVSLDGVIALDEKHDLVLLKTSLNSPALAINDKATAEVGETIFAVGNPQGLEGTFSQGIVSGLRNTPEGRWIQITAPISPGSSGGPVLNSLGEVIGIAVATLKSGQNINFAIPVSVLSELMRNLRDVSPFPKAKSIYGSSNSIEQPKAKKPPKSARQFPKKGDPDNSLDDVLSQNPVKVHSLLWDKDDYFGSSSSFTYSITNNLNQTVTGVKIVAIFYSQTGESLEAKQLVPPDSFLFLPPKASKRIEQKAIDNSVKKLTSSVEFRVLDYVIWNEQSHCPYVKRQFQSVKKIYRETIPAKGACTNTDFTWMTRPKDSGIMEEECIKCLNDEAAL
jgi:hypothetical protein